MSSTDLEAAAKEIDHLLSRPTATPNEFSTWIVNWLAANMDISTYQLRGLASTFFKAAPVIAAQERCSSGSMVNLTTIGPTLSGLSNGRYLAFWGANFRTTGGDSVGGMGLSANGGGASDSHIAKGRTIDDSDTIPIIYSRSYSLMGIDQNTLQAKYMRVAGANPQFWNRWLVAVKVGQ